MRNTQNRIMFDCFTSSHSVYFAGVVDPEFRRLYRGVVVNARNNGGYGHFAIRKPLNFWSKLPMFIRQIFPYKWVLWKTDSTRMFSLYFNDHDRSVNIVAVTSNYSKHKLSFDKATYEDLKRCIPPFLEHVGYKFTSGIQSGFLTLTFDYDNE